MPQCTKFFLAAGGLLFTIHEADENNPPIVWVRHIRHGAEVPLKKWPPEDEAA